MIVCVRLVVCVFVFCVLFSSSAIWALCVCHSGRLCRACVVVVLRLFSGRGFTAWLCLIPDGVFFTFVVAFNDSDRIFLLCVWFLYVCVFDCCANCLLLCHGFLLCLCVLSCGIVYVLVF